MALAKPETFDISYYSMQIKYYLLVLEVLLAANTTNLSFVHDGYSRAQRLTFLHGVRGNYLNRARISLDLGVADRGLGMLKRNQSCCKRLFIETYIPSSHLASSRC